MFWEVSTLLITFFVSFSISSIIAMIIVFRYLYKIVLEDVINEEVERVPREKTGDSIIYAIGKLDKDSLGILADSLGIRKRV